MPIRLTYHSYVRREGVYENLFEADSLKYTDVVRVTLGGDLFPEYYVSLPRDNQIKTQVEDGRKAWLLNNDVVMLNTLETDDPNRKRRRARDHVFLNSIDKMNSMWWASLTDTQRTTVATWRQAWLDYPATGTKPPHSDVSSVFDIDSEVGNEDNYE